MVANEQELASTFLEITMSNCRNSALSILKDARWNLEAAIQLFFDGDGSHRTTMLPSNPVFYFDSTIVPTGWGSEDEVNDDQERFDLDATGQSTVWYPEDVNQVEEDQEHLDLDYAITPTGWGSEDESEVDELQEHDNTELSVDGTPEYADILTFINERLYDDDSEFYRSESNVGTSEDYWKEEGFNETNLSRLYRCPIHLMVHGCFHEAKVEASHRDKWLVVNVQASEQFNPHMLSIDTWSNVTVEELLRSYFVFWLINQKDDEGQKVCCFYKLNTLPAILVIDPITGEKMYGFHGMKQPEDLLEDLMRFSDRSPKQHLVASTRRETAIASSDQTVTNEASQPKERSPASTTKPSYPPLPDAPTEKQLICKVGICLPSGQRVHRSFLKTDSTKLLWSFCSTLLREGEESQRFCFIVPSSSILYYDEDRSFAEAGLSNSLLRLSFGGDN